MPLLSNEWICLNHHLLSINLRQDSTVVKSRYLETVVKNRFLETNWFGLKPLLWLTNYVILDKLFQLPVPHFPYLLNGNVANNFAYQTGLLERLNYLMQVKHLDEWLENDKHYVTLSIIILHLFNIITHWWVNKGHFAYALYAFWSWVLWKLKISLYVWCLCFAFENFMLSVFFFIGLHSRDIDFLYLEWIFF